MNKEDHIWALIAKKQGGTATEKELRELNELLQQNPDIHAMAKIIFKWWDDDREMKTETSSNVLFKKILDRIMNSNDTSKTD